MGTNYYFFDEDERESGSSSESEEESSPRMDDDNHMGKMCGDTYWCKTCDKESGQCCTYYKGNTDTGSVQVVASFH